MCYLKTWFSSCFLLSCTLNWSVLDFTDHNLFLWEYCHRPQHVCVGTGSIVTDHNILVWVQGVLSQTTTYLCVSIVIVGLCGSIVTDYNIFLLKYCHRPQHICVGTGSIVTDHNIFVWEYCHRPQHICVGVLSQTTTYLCGYWEYCHRPQHICVGVLPQTTTYLCGNIVTVGLCGSIATEYKRFVWQYGHRSQHVKTVWEYYCHRPQHISVEVLSQSTTYLCGSIVNLSSLLY